MATCVYLVCGQDEYRVTEHARKVVDAVVPPGERDFGLEVLDGRADTVDAAVAVLRDTLDALQTGSFFTARHLVWLRDAGFFADNTVGRSETVKERVSELAALIKQGFMPGQHLLVTAPKVDKRYAFYKACKAVGDIKAFEVPEKAYQADKAAGAVLDELLEEMGMQMDEPARLAFRDRVGPDTRLMVNELEKLATYLGNSKRVQPEDVDAVVCSSRQAVGWDLADAVGNRDLPKALNTARRLLFQKESPIGLVSGLESRVRDLMLYRQGLDERWLFKAGKSYKWGRVPPDVDAVFSDAVGSDPRKVHWYRASILAEQAARFKQADLFRCRQSVLRAHEQLVTTSVPPALVLELLLVRMLAPKTAE